AAARHTTVFSAALRARGTGRLLPVKEVPVAKTVPMLVPPKGYQARHQATSSCPATPVLASCPDKAPWRGHSRRRARSVSAVTHTSCDAIAATRRHYDRKTSIWLALAARRWPTRSIRRVRPFAKNERVRRRWPCPCSNARHMRPVASILLVVVPI